MDKKGKIILMIVAIVLLIILLSLVAVLYTMKFWENEVDYKIIHYGHTDYRSKIISNYQEYQEFVEYVDSIRKNYGMRYDIDTKAYNEEYFDTKALAIVNITTGTGMNKFRGIKFATKDNTLIYKADIEYSKSDVVTLDMNGNLFLVEIDNSITQLKNFTK